MYTGTIGTSGLGDNWAAECGGGKCWLLQQTSYHGHCFVIPYQHSLSLAFLLSALSRVLALLFSFRTRHTLIASRAALMVKPHNLIRQHRNIALEQLIFGAVPLIQLSPVVTIQRTKPTIQPEKGAIGGVLLLLRPKVGNFSHAGDKIFHELLHHTTPDRHRLCMGAALGRREN